MKILLGADFHLNNWKNFGLDLESGLPKRLKDQYDVLLQVAELARTEKCDLVAILGDLFHKVGEIPTESLNVAKDFFDNLYEHNIPFMMLEGNHDLTCRENSKWFHSATQVFSSEDRVNLFKDLKVCLIDFSRDLGTSKVEGYDLVLVHKDLQGVSVGNYTFDKGLDWKQLSKDNKWVFCGHIHDRQQLAHNCYIVGSPMHLTFGDKGERGIYILDTDANTVKFHELNSPKFITVETKEQIQKDGNYYRLLNSKEKVDDPNVVTIVQPEYFEERLKTDDFNGILKQWLEINQKPMSYLDNIKDILVDKVRGVNEFFKGKLVQVSIEDFLSVGKISYSVTNGFILVDGKSDEFSSNGAGKSSVFGEAICWILFGETAKGLTGNDVIRNRPTQQKDCGGSLVLASQDAVYYVSRSRKGGLAVYKEVQTAVDDSEQVELTKGMLQKQAQDFLEQQVLGFNKKVFMASIYFSQENLKMLTGLSDSDKTDMITDLLGFEVYDDLYDATHEKSRVLQGDKVRLESEKQSLEFDKGKVSARFQVFESQMVEFEEEAKEASTRIKTLNESIGKLKEQLNHPPTEIEVKDFDGIMKELDEMVVAVESKMKAVLEEESELDSKQESTAKEVNSLNVKLISIDNKVKDILGEINRLQSNKMDVRCDKCGSIVLVENVRAFVLEKEALIEALEIERQELQKLLSIPKKQATEIQEQKKELKEKKFKLNAKSRDLASQLAETRKEQSAYESAVRLRDKWSYEIEKEIGQLQSTLESVQSRIEKLNKSKEEVQLKIDGIAEELTEIGQKIISKECEIVSLNEKDAILEFWKLSFSAKGIRSLLLDGFCNSFNQVIAYYISTASNGQMSIMLTPTKQTKGGEERNKVGMSIMMGNIECKYESLSGGEKRRVDFALCLGLNKWVSQQNGISGGVLGVLILDELFSFVDRSGEESIATQLFEEGKDKAVFVVSHTPELASYAKEIWTVVKENDISRLEAPK